MTRLTDWSQEAAVERGIWLGTPLVDDPLARAWQAMGLPLATLERWSTNPRCVMQSATRQHFRRRLHDEAVCLGR